MVADKTTDGFDAVEIPAGSFDVLELRDALDQAHKKPEGADRDTAIADAISSTNKSVTADVLEPGFEMVERGSLFPDKDDPRRSDALSKELVKVFNPKLLDKQVKDGVVDLPQTPPAASVAPAPGLAAGSQE